MKFWKMNGAGNDFILINTIEEQIDQSILPEIAKKVCHRHMSVGADGLMAIAKADMGGDYKMLFYNADGSMGEMCGNGARCICRYGYENGLAGEIQRVETTAGLVTGYRISERLYKIRLNDPSVIKLHESVTVLGNTYDVAYVELGNPGLPHGVVRIEGLREKSFSELFELGKALRYYKGFPKGANINFYDIDDKGIIEKTFERGVEDFTYACGTGTGSTVLVLKLLGLCDGIDTQVEMAGGKLYVTVDTDGDKITNLWLTGPTNIVCKGQLTDEELVII